MMQTTETFYIDTESDADIMAFLSQQSDRSAVICRAVRKYMKDEGISLKDIMEAVQNLQAPENRPALEDEPEEAVLAIDTLLSKSKITVE